MTWFQEVVLKQALYIAVPAVAKLLNPYLTQEAKAACVAQLRALDKKTDTQWDDLAVEALAQAWGVK